MAGAIRQMAIVIVVGGVGLSTLHATPSSQKAAADHQNTPPIVVIGPDADITVTGSRPVIRGGLWRFRRSGMIMVGGSGSIRGLGFTTCLADGTLEETLHSLAGDRSVMPRDRICTSLSMKVGNGRVTGYRSCTSPSTRIGVGAVNSKLDLSGRYDSKVLTINFLSEDETPGVERSSGPGWNPARQTGQRWRVEANREADCPVRRQLDQRNLEEAILRLFHPFVAPNND